MKFLLASLLTIMTVTAFAQQNGTKSGTVKAYNLGSSKQVNIEITGDAAEKLFTDLGDDTISASIDANESSSGYHTIYKVGKNITCDLQMKNSKNRARCHIFIENKKTGSIPRAAAG